MLYGALLVERFARRYAQFVSWIEPYHRVLGSTSTGRTAILATHADELTSVFHERIARDCLSMVVVVVSGVASVGMVGPPRGFAVALWFGDCGGL